MGGEPKGPPPRRGNDESGDDFRVVRRSYPSLKQTLGSIALILVPILFMGLLWFASQDRDGVIRSVTKVEQKADSAQVSADQAKVLVGEVKEAQRIHEARAEQQWKRVEEVLTEIKADVKDVKRATR